MEETSAEPSLKSRVLKGLLWLGGLTFVGQIVTWAVSIIVIRLLTPQDYGLMAMAAIFISFLTLLSEMGLGSALIQQKDLGRKELKQVFGFIIWVDCLLGAVIFLAAPICAAYFNEPRLIPVLRVMSVTFLLLSFYIVPQSVMIRELDFRRKSIIEVVTNLLSSAVVLSMALKGLGVWSLIGGSICMYLFRAVLFNLRPRDRVFPSFAVSGIGRMLRFGGHVSITRILWFFYSQADIFIGGRLFGKEQLGVYSISMYLVSLPLNKISPLLNQVGFTAFSRQQENLEQVQLNFIRLLRMTNILILPAFIGFCLIAPDLIPLVLGEKWISSVPLIQILCLTMPLRFISAIFPPVVSGLGYPEVITGNMMLAVVVMVLAFLGGAHLWGLIGLCYAWLGAFPIVFMVMLRRVLKSLKLPVSALIKTVVLPFWATAIMAGLVWAAHFLLDGVLPGVALLSVSIVVGAVSYTAVVLIAQPDLPREIKAFLSR